MSMHHTLPARTVRHRPWRVIAPALIIAAFAGEIRAEHIFLKDGSIINGAIVNDAAKSIIVRKADGKTDAIPRDRIMRILYTNLKMGKIHVQMRDGSNFEAFVVDEDQDTYTFRKVLLSPEETKVNRSDILFISERNPSGLKGKPHTGSIELSWFPPYNPVKHYLVYHREKSESDFRPAVMSRGKSLTLENLKSNTTYIVKITAVDNSDDESSPSNVLTVSTKNILPDPPGKITAETTAPGANGKITAQLRWQEARDPDGKITGYTVYRLTDQGKKQEARVPGTEHTIRDLAPDVRNRFEVASVDDRGDESEDTADISVGTYWKPFFEARLNYIVPKGGFSTIMKPGTGGMVTGGIRGLFFREFDLGLTTGLWRFEGNYRDIESALIMPILATARWRIDLIWNISAAPSIYAGYGYERITYARRNAATFALDTENKTSLQPMAMGGVDFIWHALKMLTVNAGLSYGAIFEGERMDMMEFHLGAGYIW